MAVRTIEEARQWRAKQEAGAAALDDKAASLLPDMHRKMKYDGALIETGTRIQWDGRLKRAAVDLWDAVENDPDHAPSLWEDVLYREGVRVIPEVITATLAFSLGEEGWWDGQVYVSQKQGNVYTPVTAPDQWKLKEKE